MKKIMSNYACQRYYLYKLGAHQITKASCEISVQSLKDISSKGGQSTKERMNYA